MLRQTIRQTSSRIIHVSVCCDTIAVQKSKCAFEVLEALLAQRRPVEENCEENALNNSESEKLLRDLEEKVVFLER